MLEGEGRVFRTGRSVVVRIAKDVAVDSAFPFKLGEFVHVQIVKGENKLVITKKEKQK